MGFTVGIDVGGTKIAGGVVDEAGTILATALRESPATDSEAIGQTIEELVGELRGTFAIDAIGVGAAGFVDVRRATVMFAANLAWRDEPLRFELETRIGLPVVIENDANAAAWGEFCFGAGADVNDLLLVTVGTGVGGGIVLDGKLHRGGFGVAAEIGHMRVVPDGLLCGCGKRGCWEQYSSGSALVRETRRLATERKPGARALLARAGGSVEAITGPMITAAAKEGDPFAIQRLEALGRWLGEGIAALAAVLDPQVVVVGGGVSVAGGLILEPALRHFRANLSGLEYRPELQIRLAQLGNRAGIIGAADLARRA